MILLLDTNILIDYLANREPFCKEWWKLEAMVEFGDAELWISSEAFTDIFYVLSGAVHGDDLQRAFTELLDFVHVVSVGEEVIREAASRLWDDFEDCVVAVCAERAGADFIITRNKQGFEKSRIPSYEVPGFFKMLENERGISFENVEL